MHKSLTLGGAICEFRSKVAFDAAKQIAINNSSINYAKLYDIRAIVNKDNEELKELIIKQAVAIERLYSI